LTGLVVDASVAVKWLLPAMHEPFKMQAEWFLEEYRSGRIQLSGPDLLWTEVSAVLLKAVRRGRIDRRQAEESIDKFLDSGVILVPSAPLLHTAFAIASDMNQSVYDAVYVALALSLNEPLITADERLFHALGPRYPVKWLSGII
jgi:predicted nucleic acid-binding protein